ncbi:hypothetical protein [Microbacterium sp. ZXX196]|uniref:hypothetical protein n=1 Tax=Microbacterium sp. ZXX196 TaxID=2609291 RepID=UPI0012B95422|nr:hypothetical protein [Microbacterium sp. ZXX196]MTE23799.1 hypothetical protein [Microbacterium sp. ZXX196]
MAVAETAARADHTADLVRLRTQISQMQRRTARVDALPVADALAPLFPEGGLRPGAAYVLPDSAALVLALLGAASREGSWAAVIGMPDLSAEAAEGYGVVPARLALIPDPGERWLQAVSSAAEVFPLVTVRAPRAATPAETARAAARLRDRGSVLLVVGDWHGADTTLALSSPEWRGLERGHGLLASRAVTLTASARRAPRPRTARVLLPGPTGGVERLAPPATARGHLRAVAS